EQLYKCKLSFDVKIEKKNFGLGSKLKIYTGEKWVTLDNLLTEEYQALEFIDEFNFFNKSTYRIGCLNTESTSLYLKNIYLTIL
ncbi:hypothetical protein N9C25_06345, partial [Saprospiraceae bacterium]|nr:hypothetical protein [Saprospiraceae bacterium]